MTAVFHQAGVQRIIALFSILCWMPAGDGVATALSVWLGGKDGLHQSYATTTEDGRTMVVLSHEREASTYVREEAIAQFVACEPAGRTQDHHLPSSELDFSPLRKAREGADAALTFQPLSITLQQLLPAEVMPRSLHLPCGIVTRSNPRCLVRSSHQVMRC